MILLVLVALVFIFPFYRIMTGAFNDPTNVWKAELFPSSWINAKHWNELIVVMTST